MGYLLVFFLGQFVGVCLLALFCCFAINTKVEQAIEEDTTIELPCKVGDTVYIIDKEQGLIEESKVLSIEYKVPNHEYYIRSERLMFYSEDVGVDVFFSKSEAEAILNRDLAK